jgi:DNA topoisomerase II
MKEMHPHKISTSDKKENYLKIKFLPDEKFFKKIDISDVIHRRLYDISGCNPGLTVYFNNKKINIKSMFKINIRF